MSPILTSRTSDPLTSQLYARLQRAEEVNCSLNTEVQQLHLENKALRLQAVLTSEDLHYFKSRGASRNSSPRLDTNFDEQIRKLKNERNSSNEKHQQQLARCSQLLRENEELKARLAYCQSHHFAEVQPREHHNSKLLGLSRLQEVSRSTDIRSQTSRFEMEDLRKDLEGLITKEGMRLERSYSKVLELVSKSEEQIYRGLRSAEASVLKVTAQLSAKSREIQTLKNALGECKSRLSKAAHIEESNSSLFQQLTSLEQDLNYKEQELHMTNDDHEIEVLRLKEELKLLKARLLATEETPLRFKEQLAVMQRNLATAEETILDLEAHRKALNTALSSMELECSKSKAEVQLLATQKAETERELADLDSAYYKLTAKCEALERSLSKLRKDTSALAKHNLELQRSFEANSIEVERRSPQATSEMHHKSTQSNSRLEDEVNDLKRQLEHYKGRKVDDREITPQPWLTSQREGGAEPRKHSKDAEGSNLYRQDLENLLLKEREKTEGLQEQVQDLAYENELLASSAVQQTNQIESLRQQVRELNGKRTERDREYDELKRTVASLEETLATIKSSFARAEDDNKALQGTVSQLNEENQRLRRGLGSSELGGTSPESILRQSQMSAVWMMRGGLAEASLAVSEDKAHSEHYKQALENQTQSVREEALAKLKVSKEKIKELKEQLKSGEDKVKFFLGELERMRAQCTEATEAKGVALKEARNSKEQMKVLKEQAQVACQRITSLSEDVERVLTAYSPHLTSHIVPERVRSRREKVGDDREEVLGNLRLAEAQVKTFTEELSAATQHINALTAQLELSSPKIAESREEIRAAHYNAELREELREARLHSKVVGSGLEEAQYKLVKHAFKTLEVELKASNEQAEHLSRKLGEANQFAQELSSELQSVRARGNETEEALHLDLKTSKEYIGVLTEQLAAAKQQVKTSTRELQRSKEANSDLEGLRDEVKRLTGQLKEANETVKELATDFAQRGALLAEQQEEMKQSLMQELKLQAEHAHSTIKILTDESGELRGALVSAREEQVTLEQQIAKLTDQVQEQEGSVQILNTQNTVHRTEAELLKNALAKEQQDRHQLTTETREELKRKDSELGGLRESLRRKDLELESLRGDLASKGSKLRSLKSDLAEKNAELGSLREDQGMKDSKLGGLRGELGRKDVELGSLREELEIKDLEFRRFKGDLGLKNLQYENLNEDLARKNTELGSLREELRRKDLELENLKEDLSSTGSDLGNLRKELTRKELELGSLREDLRRKDPELGSLKMDLARKDAELGSLMEKLRLKDLELESCKEALTSKASKLDSLKEDLASKDSQLESLREDLARQALEFGDLEILNKGLEREVDRLAEKLAEAEDLSLSRQTREDEEQVAVYQKTLRELEALADSYSLQLKEQAVLLSSFAVEKGGFEAHIREKEGQIQVENSRREDLERENGVLTEQMNRCNALACKESENKTAELKAISTELESAKGDQLRQADLLNASARYLEQKDREIGDLSKIVSSKDLQLQELQAETLEAKSGWDELVESLRQEVLVLKTTVWELEGDLTVLNEESQRRLELIETQGQKLKQVEGQLTSEQNEHMQLQALVEEYSLKIGDLETQAVLSRQAADQLKDIKAELTVKSEQREALESAKDSILELRSQLEASKALVEEYQRAMAQQTQIAQDKEAAYLERVQSLETEVERVKEDSTEYGIQPKQIMHNALKKAIENKGHENQQLKQDLEILQANLTEALHKIDRCNIQINTQHEELSQLRAALKLKEEEVLSCTSLTTEVKQKLTDAEFQTTLHRNTLKQKELEIQSLNAHCEDIELQVEQYQRATKRAQETKLEMQAVAEMLTGSLNTATVAQQMFLSELTQRVEVLGTRVSVLGDRVKGRGATSEGLEEGTPREESNTDVTSQALVEQLASANQHTKQLEQMVEMQKTKLKELLQVEEELSTKLEAAFKRVQKAEDDKRLIETQLQVALGSMSGARKGDLSQLIERNKELEKECRRLRDLEGYCEDLEFKASSMTEKVKVLMMEREETISHAKNISQTHRRELTALADSLDLKSKYTAQLVVDLDSLKRQKDELQGRLDQMSQKTDLTELMEELEAAKFKVKLLEEQLNASDSEFTLFSFKKTKPTGQSVVEVRDIVKAEDSEEGLEGEEVTLGEGQFDGQQWRVAVFGTELKMYVEEALVFSTEDWLMNPDALRLSLERIAKALEVPVDQAEIKLYEFLQDYKKLKPVESVPHKSRQLTLLSVSDE
jgi:chromosome segregation ATPase